MGFQEFAVFVDSPSASRRISYDTIRAVLQTLSVVDNIVAIGVQG